MKDFEKMGFQEKWGESGENEQMGGRRWVKWLERDRRWYGGGGFVVGDGDFWILGSDWEERMEKITKARSNAVPSTCSNVQVYVRTQRVNKNKNFYKIYTKHTIYKIFTNTTHTKKNIYTIKHLHTYFTKTQVFTKNTR
jgi:hypothetical protein